MPERAVGVTDTTSGAGIADIRVRERSVGGATVGEQYVIPVGERVDSFKGMATTFRTPGRAATAQNLFSISNAVGSTVLVALRRLTVQQDSAAVANISWPNQFKATRVAATVPLNGTVLSKVGFDSTESSSASVEVKGDSQADGTSTTLALTGALGALAWHQYAMRVHTAVGQILIDDGSLIPGLCDQEPIILRANEAILVGLVANAATANGATITYLVNAVWEEFTLP